jgi:hypothetical protein
MHFTWIYNDDFERLVFRFPNVYLQIILFLFNIFPSNFHSKKNKIKNKINNRTIHFGKTMIQIVL